MDKVTIKEIARKEDGGFTYSVERVRPIYPSGRVYWRVCRTRHDNGVTDYTVRFRTRADVLDYFNHS